MMRTTKNKSNLSHTYTRTYIHTHMHGRTYENVDNLS